VQNEAPLSGAIEHLTVQCGGTVHTEQVVTINGDQAGRPASRFAASAPADLTSRNYFQSKKEAPKQTLESNFRNLRVNLSHYSIQSNINEWM
jgi:hypothetical protein